MLLQDNLKNQNDNFEDDSDDYEGEAFEEKERDDYDFWGLLVFAGSGKVGRF